MNVFVVALNIQDSARELFHIDHIRASKQIVELCQMLAQVVDFEVPKADGTPYKLNKSIRNHPATHWVAEHKQQAIAYLYELVMEYSRIKHKHHGCLEAALKIREGCNHKTIHNFFNLGWHTYKTTLKEILGHTPQGDTDIVSANRIYLAKKQQGFFSNKVKN